MMAETSNSRLRKARLGAGFKSARQAAMTHHWVVSTYASHENGQTPVPAEAARDYAKKFGVSAGWILTGEGDRHTPQLHPRKRQAVPVTGYVGAGAAVFPFEDSVPIDEVEMPHDDNNLNCVIVRGLSMYPRYFDGEKLFYPVDRQSPSRLINEECVLRLTTGEMLVKIIRRGSKKTLFNLESWNAPLMEDQPIDWACPIVWRGR